MFDLSNKYFQTEDDNESEKLLRIAVAQGYKLPSGLKSLVNCRIFKFTGFPYRSVSTHKYTDSSDMPQGILTYKEVFGNENAELKDILNRSARFCKTYGYNMLRIYADESETEYTASGFAKTEDGGNFKTEISIQKPKKVTIDEIEKRFGCPIEIVP